MLTFPLSAPQMLWTVLLVTSLSAQNGKWDNPTCTEGVLSVPRGERAVMGCNISNPFLSVAVTLGTPGASVQPLFRVRSPGCFCREGWHLRVQGGVARLVIANASASQAGRYKWHLLGLQRNVGVTTLNVSGPETPRLPEARDPLAVVLVVSSIIVGLLLLVLAMLACTKGIGPLRYCPQKCSGPQESWF